MVKEKTPIQWGRGFQSTMKIIDLMTARRPRSENSVENYLCGVKVFCEQFMKIDNPDECLAAISNDPRKYVDEFIDFLMTDRSTHTTRSYYVGVRVWLKMNGFDVKTILKGVELPVVSTIVEDRAPTKKELNLLMDFANMRDKAVTEIGVSSGLRLNTIATLTWGDITLDPRTLYEPSLRERDHSALPALIKVRQKKGRKMPKIKKFFTFISPEAKRVLLQYKAWRERQGEIITEDSPLIGSLHQERYPMRNLPNQPFGSLISGDHLSKSWVRLLEKAGLTQKTGGWHELHFHTLRKFFETACINAGVKKPYREFWMGHKGEYLDDSYFRANLREHLAEYQKVVPYVAIMETPTMSEDERRIRSFLDSAKTLVMTGLMTQEQYETLELRLMSAIKTMTFDDALKMARTLLEQREKEKTESEDCQKIVSEEDLERYLAEGWRIVTALPSGKIVIEKT